MNILQIANYTKGVGGISAQVELLTNNLRDEGYNCKVISTKGSILCRIKSLLSIIKHGRDFSVFHIHACSNRGFFPAIVGITLGRALKKKVLLTYHGGDAESFFSKHPRLIRHYLCKTDHNIVLSGYLGSIFDKYDIPYTVIPNIVSFRPDLFKDRTIIKPRFICIRSLRPLYNIKCILQAYQLVQDKLPGAELTFVGDALFSINRQYACLPARRFQLRTACYFKQCGGSPLYSRTRCQRASIREQQRPTTCRADAICLFSSR